MKMYLLWFIVYSLTFLSTVWSKQKQCDPHHYCLSCNTNKRIVIYSACHQNTKCNCEDCELDCAEQDDDELSDCKEDEYDDCPCSENIYYDADLKKLYKQCSLKQSCKVAAPYSDDLHIKYFCAAINETLFRVIELGGNIRSINRKKTLFYHEGDYKTEPVNVECTILPESNKKMNIYLHLVKISESSGIRVKMISRTINQSFTAGRFVYRHIYPDIRHKVDLSFVLYPGHDDIISIGIASSTPVNINCIRYSITTISTPSTPTPSTPTASTPTTSTPTPSIPSTPTTLIPTTSTEMSNKQPVNSPSTVGSTVGWTVGVIVVVVIVVVCIVIVTIVRKKRICNSSKSNVGGITDRINMGYETSHDYEAPDEPYYMELNANVEDTLTACTPPSGSVQDKTTEDDYNHIGNQDKTTEDDYNHIGNQDKSTNGYSSMLNSHQNDYNHINLTNNSNSDNMPPDGDVYKHLNQVKSDNSAMNNLNQDYDHLPVTLEDSYQTLRQDMKDPKHDPNYDHFPELKSGI